MHIIITRIALISIAYVYGQIVHAEQQEEEGQHSVVSLLFLSYFVYNLPNYPRPDLVSEQGSPDVACPCSVQAYPSFGPAFVSTRL